MVPGYTGYIPKKEEHFGTRYAVGCHRAIGDFETDRKNYSSKQNDRLEIVSKPKQNALQRGF